MKLSLSWRDSLCCSYRPDLFSNGRKRNVTHIIYGALRLLVGEED